METRQTIQALHSEAQHKAFDCYVRRGRVPKALLTMIRAAEVLEQAYDLAERQERQKRWVAARSKYSPSQPRAPAGSPDGGQWVDVDGGRGGRGDGGDEASPFLDGAGINDPPLEPVYPVENTLLMFFGGQAVRAARGALGLAGRAQENGMIKPINGVKQTYHGAQRFIERGFTEKEVSIAIKTAERANRVTEKIGKYGTPQKVYRGTNNVTVIIETSKRNAGKIITLFRTTGEAP